MNRKSFFILTLVIATVLTGVTVVRSSQSVSAWPFSNTRALVFSGFPGGENGAVGGITMSDAEDNIVVLNITAGTVQVDPSDPATVAGNGNDWTQLLSKYSPRGELLWSHSWPHIWGDFGLYDLAITPIGEVIVVGDVTVAGADVDPSSGTYNVSNANSAVIMKFSATGNLMWVREISSTTSVSFQSLRLTTDGSIVVAGQYEGTMSLDGPGGASGLTFTSAGRTDLILAVFDSSGVEKWAATGNSSDPDFVSEIEISSSGEILMLTMIRDTISLRSASGAITTVNPLSSGTYNALLWKLNANGEGVWVAQPIAGTGADEQTRFLVVRKSGDILVSLSSNHVMSVTAAGVQTDMFQTSGDISDIEELSSGVIAISGIFQNTMDLDPTSGVDNYTSVDPSNEGFVTLLSSSLGYLSSRVYSAIGPGAITDVSRDNDGGWIVTGWTLASSSLSLSTTSESAVFEPAAGADSMNHIVRYQADGSTAVPVPAAPTDALYTPGNKAATLQWTAMRHASRYVVSNSAGETVCDTTTNSCQITGLRNGRFKNFSITAYNYVGVASSTTPVKAMGGFLVKTTTWKVRSKPRLSNIVTTPSKGKKTWRVRSGQCRMSGKRLVMPTKKGRCTLVLTVAKKAPYKSMSTTVRIIVNR